MRRIGPLRIITLALVVTFVLSACGGGAKPASAPPPPGPPPEYEAPRSFDLPSASKSEEPAPAEPTDAVPAP